MALANGEAAKGEDIRDINKIQQYLNNSIAASIQSKNMSPNDVSAVELLALIYENAALYVPDSLKLAEDNYTRALELEPHNPVYYVKLGQIKIGMAASMKTTEEKKKLVGEAKDLFQKAIDEKNNYDSGYYQIALSYEALSDLDKAIENGAQAVQINPRNANYLLAMGRMHQARNKGEDMKKAEGFYKGVVALNDNDINGHFYLGLFYEKNKNKEGAKAEYKKVISLIEESENEGNEGTMDQLRKMIDNADKGIANTPESLGLVQQQQEIAPETIEANSPSQNVLTPEVSPEPIGPEPEREP
jgi:cytochrome c-type biogenesis protein CcmH/NrfG